MTDKTNAPKPIPSDVSIVIEIKTSQGILRCEVSAPLLATDQHDNEANTVRLAEQVVYAAFRKMEQPREREAILLPPSGDLRR